MGLEGLDFIVGTGDNAWRANGDIATRLLQSQFNIGALRPFEETIKNEKTGQMVGTGRFFINHNGIARPVNNATLRYDEWKQYDIAVIKAARERLVVADTFLSRGLTYTFGNGLGKTVLTYEDLNDFNDATVGMDPLPTAVEDRPVYGMKYMPLPVIYKEFRLNIRQLNASRTTGEPLDVTGAEMAGRKVAEMIETITCVGSSSFAFGGGTLYGLKDFTYSTTGSLTADWDDSAATGETILADVIAMKQAAIDDRHYGPYGIFIPTNYETALDADFKAGSDKTIRQRLLEVEGIEFIKVADKMTADYVVLVELTSDTMRMIVGLPITTVQWESRGGLSQHFMVMAIILPQPRADQNNRSGIVVYN